VLKTVALFTVSRMKRKMLLEGLYLVLLFATIRYLRIYHCRRRSGFSIYRQKM
jgi:hypothetical protein